MGRRRFMGGRDPYLIAVDQNFRSFAYSGYGYVESTVTESITMGGKPATGVSIRKIKGDFSDYKITSAILQLDISNSELYNYIRGGNKLIIKSENNSVVCPYTLGAILAATMGPDSTELFTEINNAAKNYQSVKLTIKFIVS